MSEVTLITATGDRPQAFRLCEQWMGRQTFQDYDWIVVDDGVEATEVTREQQYIRLSPAGNPAGNPADSFRRNLSVALECVQTPKVLFIEDDDYYTRWYVEYMVRLLDVKDLCGEGCCKYYNLKFQRYLKHANRRHASLCQTGIRTGEYLTRLHDYIRRDPRPQQADGAIWKRLNVPDAAKLLIPVSTHCIAMKALPGRQGLGIHHQEDELEKARYAKDETGDVLRQWVGQEDAEVYLQMYSGESNEVPLAE